MSEDRHELTIRQGIILNNVGVTLLKKSRLSEAWTTCHDAIQVMKLSLPPLPNTAGSLSSSDFESKVETVIGRARRALDLANDNSSSVCSRVGVEIFFDPSSVPDLNHLHLNHSANGIGPVKLDLQACPASSPLISQEVVSAVILFNLALVNCLLDANPPSVTNEDEHPPIAANARKSIKLLSLSMDLIHRRLESTVDVSEQVGLLFLALLSLQAIFWILKYRCPDQGAGHKKAEMEVYAFTHAQLLERALILASLEVVTIQAKPTTAPVA